MGLKGSWDHGSWVGNCKLESEQETAPANLGDTREQAFRLRQGRRPIIRFSQGRGGEQGHFCSRNNKRPGLHFTAKGPMETSVIKALLYAG